MPSSSCQSRQCRPALCREEGVFPVLGRMMYPGYTQPKHVLPRHMKTWPWPRRWRDRRSASREGSSCSHVPLVLRLDGSPHGAAMHELPITRSGRRNSAQSSRVGIAVPRQRHAPRASNKRSRIHTLGGNHQPATPTGMVTAMKDSGNGGRGKNRTPCAGGVPGGRAVKRLKAREPGRRFRREGGWLSHEKVSAPPRSSALFCASAYGAGDGDV